MSVTCLYNPPPAKVLLDRLCLGTGLQDYQLQPITKAFRALQTMYKHEQGDYTPTRARGHSRVRPSTNHGTSIGPFVPCFLVLFIDAPLATRVSCLAKLLDVFPDFYTEYIKLLISINGITEI